jgi:hypothetical protein
MMRPRMGSYHHHLQNYYKYLTSSRSFYSVQSKKIILVCLNGGSKIPKGLNVCRNGMVCIYATPMGSYVFGYPYCYKYLTLSGSDYSIQSDINSSFVCFVGGSKIPKG